MAPYHNSNMFNHLIQSDRTITSGLGGMDSNDTTDDNDSDTGSNASLTSGPSRDYQSGATYFWSTYSIPQMRELLRQRGQLTTGGKNALKKRLKNSEGIATTTTFTSGKGATTTTAAAATATATAVDADEDQARTAGTPVETSPAERPTVGTIGSSEGRRAVSATSYFDTTAAMTEDMEDTFTVRSTFDEGITRGALESVEYRKPTRTASQSHSQSRPQSQTPTHSRSLSMSMSMSMRSRFPKRTNSFSAHFADFINRRRDALETERHEISVYTSPMTVLSYFVLYILHEFRMALLWIISQQYLLVVLPIIAATVYFVYQTDGAHQPLLKHAESGLIWYGYWTLLGIASSVGLGTGLHTFILFLGPHIAEVTVAAYKCGNTQFDVRGDHRYICKSPESMTGPLGIYVIFQAVQWESFFWGLGTALGELPPYFVARAAALSGNRNEELAAIEDLLKKKPDSVSYKERILLMVHEGMKRLGFFGIFLCASIPNPLFDLAGITCGHFLIPFSTFFGATFLGKAVVKSSIQTVFVILMFSADTLASFMSWLERSVPFIHGHLADGINSQKGALSGGGHGSVEELENSTSLVGLIWNTVIFIMISYFLLSIVETMALAQIKRRHDREIVELEGKIRSGDTKALFHAVSDGLVESSKRRSSQETQRTTTSAALDL